MRPLILCSRVGVLVVFTALLVAARASAQVPVAPADGSSLGSPELLFEWRLDPGVSSLAVELSDSPTTSEDGSFSSPVWENAVAAGNFTDVAWQEEIPLTVGRRYYWHVRVRTAGGAIGYGPVSSFRVTEYPPVTGACGRTAARELVDRDLLPRADEDLVEQYPDSMPWFAEADWSLRPVLCRDLTGDGKREMITWMQCCTGGSPSPWAIFKRNADGGWSMAYHRALNTVWRVRVAGRTVRASSPAPYNGACTRFTRDRVVRWSGGRFRSELAVHRQRHRVDPVCR